MKKLTGIVMVLVCFMAAGLPAQDLEIYPQIGAPSSISIVSFSSDGKYLLTVDSRKIIEGGSVKIWDAATGRELKTLINVNSPSYIQDAIYSPNGQLCLVITNSNTNGRPDNGTIRLVNIEKGNTVTRFRGHTGRITGAVFSPDGGRVASCSEKIIRIWDAASGQEIRSIDTATNINTVAWAPNGTNIASGSADGIIKTWDTGTGRELKTLAKYQDKDGNRLITPSIKNLTYSPDGHRIAAYMGNFFSSMIVTVDTQMGGELTRISSNSGDSVVYSPDGQSILGDGVLFDAGTGRQIRQFSSGKVSAAAISRDGRRVAIGDDNGIIKIFNFATGRELLDIRGHTAPSNEISYSPDGNYIAAAFDTTILIWDTKRGQIINKLTGHGGDKKNRNRDPIIKIAWSQNGRLLASSGMDQTVKVWDVSNGRCLFTFTELGPADSETEFVQSLGFSPDGKYLVTANNEKSIRLWDAATGRAIRYMAGELSHPVTTVFFSKDGRQLITGGEGYHMKTWNVDNGRLFREMQTFGSDYLALSPDGKRLASTKWDRVSIWDSESGNQVKTIIISNYDYPLALTYSHDGKRIMVSTEKNIRIYDASNLELISSFYPDVTSTISSANFSVDGKWVTAGFYDGTVRLYSAETFAEKARFIAYDDDEWLAMTPDGYYAASANGDKYLNVRVGNTVTGIDRYRSTFNKPAVVAARLSNSGRMTHDDTVISVAVNPAGTRIAAVSHDKLIKLWDLESGRELRTISNIGGYVNTVSWSPDGKYLINGAEDKTIRIWDAETGRAVRTITGHTDYVNEARYSPDGRRIASCADDKLIKIWDAETGREIRTLSGHTDGVSVVAWSPDGKRIASGSNQTEKAIRIWDAESGRVLQTITGQGGRINALVFSPDGRRLASSTPEDKAIKIWDAETGREIRSIPIMYEGKTYNGGVFSLAWSPDGKRIVSGAIYGGKGSGDHVEIWNTETGECIRSIREKGTVLSITFTPDGRRIVAGCTFTDARFIKVYDALTGNEL
jgi:WD40 repeat protein